jgi:protein gp37
MAGPLHWVIVGGESGPNARPMHPDWARSLRDQCAAAAVPFFFKQWGEWGPYDRGRTDGATLATANSLDTPVQRFGKSRAGRLLDGREHNDMPGGSS